MAELLTENPSAGVTAPPPDALSQVLYGDAGQPLNPANLAQHSTTGKALMAAMPDLVKGAGFATKGGNQPLTDATQITLRAQQAATDLRAATYQGFNSKSSVVKSHERRLPEPVRGTAHGADRAEHRRADRAGARAAQP